MKLAKNFKFEGGTEGIVAENYEEVLEERPSDCTNRPNRGTYGPHGKSKINAKVDAGTVNTDNMKHITKKIFSDALLTCVALHRGEE